MLSLSVPAVISFAFLHYQKNQIKKAVKQQIVQGVEEKELITLKFTKKESKTKLRWEHPGEFEFGGQMYDVVGATVVGDTIQYKCWWDHAETALNNQLDSILSIALGKNKQRNEQQKNLFNFYKSLFFKESIVRKTVMPYLKKRIHQFPTNRFLLYYPPPVPPPEPC